MKSAVDRVDSGELLTTGEASATSEVVAAPEAEPRRAPRPDAERTREFDDIPSVIRALLVGYDEV